MRITVIIFSLLFLFAGPAVADPADHVAELKDVITGTVSVPGESFSVVLSAPAGTKLVLKAKKVGKENPGVTITLQDPDETVIPLVRNKAVLETSGVHRITMTAGEGLTGKFILRIRGTPPNHAKFKEIIDEQDQAERRIPFAVLPETRLNYRLTKADPTYLYGPDGYELELFTRKQNGLLLQAAGDYELGVRGSGGKAKASLRFFPPAIVKRKLWISNAGYGEAPIIESLDPAQGLGSRPIEGVIVTGDGFDPDATAELVKGKLTLPVDLFWVSEEEALFSADLTGAKQGAWKLVVTNPSGATAETKFRVINPSSIYLPDGIEDGTEIWYLDFNDAFTQDLYEFGLAKPVGAGGSNAVNQHVRRVMKAYVLYWLRSWFGTSGTTGQVTGAAVPISFIVSEVPTVAGTAGNEYNRIEIGGTALTGAKTDNPVLHWGYTPVDAGNVAIDDITGGGDEEPTARVPVFEMRPSNTQFTTSPWRQAFAGLVAAPVTDTDAGLFSSDPKWFLNRDDANIVRYKLLVPAVELLSKELAAVVAHHVARAMGIENGTEGVMSLPTLYGEFSNTVDLGFTEQEKVDLRVRASPVLLPGKSRVLRMKPFQMNPGQPSVLTVLGGVLNQERLFYPTGGRPDRRPEDMQYQIYYNSTGPLGVSWPNAGTTGLMTASPPAYLNGVWYTDAVYFQVVATDTVDGNVSSWNHRLNVLVDISPLSGSQLGSALLVNRNVVEGPAR